MRVNIFFATVAIAAMAFIIIGCAGNPSIPPSENPTTPTVQFTPEQPIDGLVPTSSSDKFLGEFEIVEQDGEPVIIETRSAQKDYDATGFLSLTNSSAPLYLHITNDPNATWEDDKSEPDPKQGWRTYNLELTNNTNLLIYDPWLIFTELGQKTFVNPAGITSRAYVASKPYASFVDSDGTIKAHSTRPTSCKVFFPKAEPTLASLDFKAYGSYPEDYIEVGEGSADMKPWRDAYDAAKGRAVVGSAIGKVEECTYPTNGKALIQRFSGGIHNSGVLFYNPNCTYGVIWIWNPIWACYAENVLDDSFEPVQAIEYDFNECTKSGCFYLQLEVGEVVCAITASGEIAWTATIHGAIYTYWVLSGGRHSSWIGLPITSEDWLPKVPAGTNIRFNRMERGIIIYAVDGWKPECGGLVGTPVLEKWKIIDGVNEEKPYLGKANGIMGNPIIVNPFASSVTGKLADGVDFEGGFITWITSDHQSGEAWATYGEINTHWAEWGGIASCGFPISDQEGLGNGKWSQTFEGGVITSHIYYDTWWIRGPILAHWLANGGLNGKYAAAMSGEYEVYGGIFRAQDFETATLCCYVSTKEVTEGCPTSPPPPVYDLSYWISWVALNMYFPGQYVGVNCKEWARDVTEIADDKAGCPGTGLPSGDSYGQLVYFDSALPGDMLQLGYYSGYSGIVHTAIIIQYLGNGVFHVRDSNWHLDCKIDDHNIDTKKYPSADPRVYRINCK